MQARWEAGPEAQVPWAGSVVELWSQSSTALERAREQAVIAQ